MVQFVATKLARTSSLNQTTSEILFKVGAISGQTAGYSSYRKSNDFMKVVGDTANSQGSVESCIIGAPEFAPGSKSQFASHGDSVAAVYNHDDNWVGIVSGGVSVAQTQDHITYITPATDIEQQFSTITNGGTLTLY